MPPSADPTLPPFRLRPWFSPRVWGRRDLSPWYPHVDAAEPIGEAWLTGPESVIDTGALAGSTLAEAAAAHPLALLGDAHVTEFPLLVKILFPEEKLSVQVHPDDHHAQLAGQPRGKTECWYVLEARPGASVALGLQPGTTAQAIREAIASQTMESLLQWMSIAVGDMLFVDAGTVHAIGPGSVLLEIQQTSDLTYRIYDYGRPRELHLDAALRVMKTVTAAGKVAPIACDGFSRLIEKNYFTADRFNLRADERRTLLQPAIAPQCLTIIAGGATISTPTASIELHRGQTAVVPASCATMTVQALEPTSLIRCFSPSIR